MTFGLQSGRIGTPSLGLSEAQLQTILKIVVLAARLARPMVVQSRLAKMRVDENFISMAIMQWLVEIQHRRNISSFMFIHEAVKVSPLGQRPKILGRIDYKVMFPQHFGRYDAYLGVESKRIASDRSGLLRYYVATGVGKFASGVYGTGHPAGILVGYVVRASNQTLSQNLSNRVVKAFPGAAAFTPYARQYGSATILEGIVPRQGHPPVRLIHALVPMH